MSLGVLTDEITAGVYALDEEYELHVVRLGEDVYGVVLTLFGEEYPSAGDPPIIQDGASIRAYLATLALGSGEQSLKLFCSTCDRLLWLECSIAH